MLYLIISEVILEFLMAVIAVKIGVYQEEERNKLVWIMWALMGVTSHFAQLVGAVMLNKSKTVLVIISIIILIWVTIAYLEATIDMDDIE